VEAGAPLFFGGVFRLRMMTRKLCAVEWERYCCGFIASILLTGAGRRLRHRRKAADFCVLVAAAFWVV